MYIPFLELGGTSSQGNSASSSRFAVLTVHIHHPFSAIYVAPAQSLYFSRTYSAPEHESHGCGHVIELFYLQCFQDCLYLSQSQDMNHFFSDGDALDTIYGIDVAPALPLTIGEEAVQDGFCLAEDMGTFAEMTRQDETALAAGDAA